MTDRVEDLLDRYLDLRLQGAAVEVESLLAEHPEIEEHERERFRRLAEFLGGGADGSPGPSARAAPAGGRLGPYILLRELGRGGQGTVYLAKDTRLARMVALKVSSGSGLELGASSEGERFVARMRREAEVVSRLAHPGICVVYEMGTAGNVHYIAMRYVEGETLSRKIAAARADPGRIAGSPASPMRSVVLHGAGPGATGPGTPPSSGRRGVESILALVEQSARALHAAHEAGVVHRDVKPGNIMVTPEGEPVLLDFGLARDMEPAAATLTLSGEFLGTPAYMSPEQVSPLGAPVDRRTDGYSLGVTLYEVLTLERPFEAPTRELLYRRILTEQPSRPGRRNASIPRDLEIVIATALEKDVDHRYQTALDLAEDLRRVRVHEPIRARPPGPLLRLTRWVQRSPVLAAAVGGLFLALGAGLSVSLLLMSRVRDALVQAQGGRLVAESRACLAANPGLALLLALEGERHSPGLSANNALIRAIGDLREQRLLLSHRLAVTGAATSPDGRFLARAFRDGTIEVSERDTWTSIAVLDDFTDEVSRPAFSPDGGLMAAAGSDGTCRVWSTATWKPVRVLRGPHPWGTVRGFDRAGRRLATTWASAEGATAVRVWDIERDELLYAGDPGVESYAGASISPDGERLLLESQDGVRVVRLDAAATGPLLEIPDPARKSGVHAIFSPDGSRSVVQWHGGAGLWDTSTEEKVLDLGSEGSGLGRLVFGPDGRRLLVTHWDSAAVWDAVDGSQVCRLRLAEHGSEACFSPDAARILLTAGTSASLWDADAGKELARFRGHEDAILDARFSRSGRTVITSSADGTVREWSFESEGQRKTFRSDHGPFLSVGFDPTGRRIETATELGGIQGFDLDTREAARDLLDLGRLTSLSFGPNGRSVLAVRAQGIPVKPGESVQALDVETGASLALFPHPQGTQVYDAQFSPDGRLVVTACDDHKARIWEAHTGKPVLELVGHVGGVRSAAFGPGGERVVTTSEQDESVRVWDASSGAQLAVLSIEGEKPANASLSPDGRRVVAGFWRGNVCLWQVSSQEPVLWRAHRGTGIATVAFSADGTRILTAGIWPGARLWSTDNQQEIATLDERLMKRPCFDPSGRWIAAISEEGSAHVWPLDPVQRAREIAPRDFTPEERQRYELEP